jgi:hypothetical protein
MKSFILILLLLQSISAEELNTMQHQSLHSYNNKPSVKHKLKQKMHKMHKIDEVQALKIAQEICKNKKITLTLVHKKAFLLYAVKSKHCSFFINALDGKIINKQMLWRK